MSRRLFLAVIPTMLLVPACRDDSEALTAPSLSSPANAAAATALAFRQVSAGGYHTCGVTNDNVAYCWGVNGGGELGNGTTTGADTCQPFDRPCSTRPVAVAGGYRFRYISAGEYHTCAVTTDRVAYCWGSSGVGEPGWSAAPVAVSTTLRFVQIASGGGHTCGLTYPDRRAYCWGSNNFGQLGNGSNTGPELCSVYSYACSTRPVAVAGGRAYRQVTAGRFHTCALTTAGKAYCWGDNRYGGVGDSSHVPLRRRPSLVAGGHAFEQIAAGGGHTCAVTDRKRAYCWGAGQLGPVGDGTSSDRFWPTRVAGGLSLERVTAGVAHTCGESTANVAYCWGANTNGAIGDGTTIYRTTPAAVAGGHPFAQLSASHGGVHSCGITSAGAVYCWGSNFLGQLGDGTQDDRLTPVRIADAM